MTVLTKVLPSRETQRVMKVVPLMELLNREIIGRAANFTYAELQARFAEHDVWWCPVRTTHTMVGYEQAHRNGAFQVDESGQLLVSSPTDIDHVVTPATRPSPALGQHNSEIINKL